MPTTWNPADKNAGIALTGSNLIATSSAGSGTVNQAVRATTAISPTIKQYFEVTVSGTMGQYLSVGVLNSGATLSNDVGAVNGAAFCHIFSPGTSKSRMNGAISGSWPPISAGQVVRVAIDRNNNRIWWALNNNTTNGTAWMGDGTINADPVTNTGGLFISAVTGTIFPAFSSAWTGDVATLNPGPTGFAYAVPSGFIALDGVATTPQARAMVLA